MTKKIISKTFRLGSAEDKSLSDFAHEHSDGNLSSALRTIIRAVCNNTPVLLFLRQIARISIDVNRICHLLREQKGVEYRNELQPLVVRLEVVASKLLSLLDTASHRDQV